MNPFLVQLSYFHEILLAKERQLFFPISDTNRFCCFSKLVLRIFSKINKKYIAVLQIHFAYCEMRSYNSNPVFSSLVKHLGIVTYAQAVRVYVFTLDFVS